jgi:PAS domain S-box-containing protein
MDANAALLAQTGYRREEIVGRTARELSVYVDEHDFERVRNLLAGSREMMSMDRTNSMLQHLDGSGRIIRI